MLNTSNVCFTFQMEPARKRAKVNSVVNPWAVEDASVFLRYCCPECDTKCIQVEDFAKHAISNHTRSSTLFPPATFVQAEFKSEASEEVFDTQSDEEAIPSKTVPKLSNPDLKKVKEQPPVDIEAD